jgi:hypothetical protein
LDEGDYSGAIRLGESISSPKREFITNINLAHAYALSGQKEKAEELFQSLKQIEEVPKYFTRETMKQALDDLQKNIEEKDKPKEDQSKSNAQNDSP